ncbi:hypothetical protein RD110_15260 [Rhodoferax koreense]|uniref:KaiB domain-containing protein n=1 Tax=Rhodoferax koreensis TaxID=1842727 RepID=A0A1P8JXA9_9BURK|nr:circadian clock KaiB family protein [Rhodoferax koreense]APW38383.1 hypothetical protein RD110_15260 [Rhodoferax koreense]
MVHETSSRNRTQLYRLYVSAASPLSSRAIVNSRSFLERHLPGLHRLAVLDIAANVTQAKLDQIIASPTLVRLSPLPQRRFVGDMSDTERLRVSLGLQPVSGEP